MCIQHRITSHPGISVATGAAPKREKSDERATTRGWSESGWCSLAAFHCPTRNMDLPGSQVDDELCSLLYSGTLLKDSTEERRKLRLPGFSLGGQVFTELTGQETYPVYSPGCGYLLTRNLCDSVAIPKSNMGGCGSTASHFREFLGPWLVVFFWPGHLMKGHWFRPRRGQRSKFQTLQPTIWPPRVLFCGSLPNCDRVLSYFCCFFIVSPKLFGSFSPSDFNPGTSSKDHQSLR